VFFKKIDSRACAFTGSPAKTPEISLSCVSVTSRIKSWRAMCAISQLGMQRIALDGALGGQRLAHEARRVDRPLMVSCAACPGAINLARRRSQHQVLLVLKPSVMLQIGGHESLVDVDWRSAACDAERAVRNQIARVVMTTRYFPAISGPTMISISSFVAPRCSPVADQDGDAFDGNSGSVQACEQWRQGD